MTSCSPNKVVDDFDPDDFHSDSFITVLSFDLRTDNVVAGVVLDLNELNTQYTEQHTLLLPFSSAVEYNKNLSVSWGSYENYTIINYIVSPKMGGIEGIGIDVGVEIQDEAVIENPNCDNFVENIRFYRNGQERLFIYKYPDYSKDVTLITFMGFIDRFDAIAIAKPDKATGVEIRDNRTTIPDPIEDNSIAQFFASNASTAGEKCILVRYRIPATQSQRLVMEYLVKLFGVIIAPIAQIILIPTINPTRRKGIVIIGIVFEILVVIAIILYGIYFQQDFGLRFVFDIILSVLGLGGALLVAILKTKG